MVNVVILMHANRKRQERKTIYVQTTADAEKANQPALAFTQRGRDRILCSGQWLESPNFLLAYKCTTSVGYLPHPTPHPPYAPPNIGKSQRTCEEDCLKINSTCPITATPRALHLHRLTDPLRLKGIWHDREEVLKPTIFGQNIKGRQLTRFEHFRVNPG